MFDPWAPLADAVPWLADPKKVSASEFQSLAAGIKQMLSISSEAEIKRYNRTLRVKLRTAFQDINDLSDGYQSVLAFILDIAMGFGRQFEYGFAPSNFEGLVLLDELEVHLHPEWKRRVVSDLRNLFPGMQFIATTHDPLCLRGLEKGELHILTRDEDDEISLEQVDVPAGLDADEILTGEWFNLESTLDRKTEDALVEYRERRASGTPPDSPELATLQRQLERSLGSYVGTSAGRVMLEATGEYLEEAHTKSGADRLTKDQIKARLLQHAKKDAGS